MSSTATSVQVALRVRGLTPLEEDNGCKNAVLVQDELGSVAVGQGQSQKDFT
jgi:hypothetical protein